MRYRAYTGVAIGLVAAALVFGPANSEEPASNDSTCEIAKATHPDTGTYHPFTFGRQIRLGFAYYFDPKLVQKAVVAYSYAPNDFKASDKSSTLFESAKDGTIAFALPARTSDTVKVVSAVAASRLKGIKLSSGAEFSNSIDVAQGLKIVATSDLLCGVKAKGRIVSWGEVNSIGR